MPISDDARTAARLGAAIAVAVSLAFCALPAGAEGPADEAELHFQLGAEAYQRADYRGALEHFFFSNRLVPNRNVIFNIARTFEQMKRYADAHRYYIDALAGETNPRVIADVKAAITHIAPNVAVIDVVTTPPGATIYLDRQDLGSHGLSPRPLALAPGSYRVLATLDGYKPRTSSLVVAELGKETPVALTLTRIVGTVSVKPEGAGARGAAVRVDDEHAPPTCSVPCDLQLPPGSHQLFFDREGYRGVPRQVVVAVGRATETTAELRPITGSLVVSTDERGALVTIDGRAVGFTPAVIPSVPVGRQRVRVTKSGFAPIEREIIIQPSQQAQLVNLELQPVREVTAVSRFVEAIEDAPSSVSILDGRELRAFGYPTIAEALRGVRGVYLSNDRVYYSAGVRGLGQPNDYGNRVLVLSDGQPLNDNLLDSSYIGSDGRVDLDDVDRIEVVRGPGSLLYGTGAFSGVVNLVTRPRDASTEAHVSLGTYDNAVFHANAGLHYTLGNNKGAWASASFARSDGIDVGIPLTTPPPGGRAIKTAHGVDKFTSGGAAGRAFWGPLTVQWFYQKRDQSTPVGSYGTVFDDPRSGSIDTRMMVEARFEPYLSPNLQLMTRVHANRYFFDGTYIFPASTHQENFAGSFLGAEARLVWSPSPRLRITAGAEGKVHPEATLTGISRAPGAPLDRYLNVEMPYQSGAGYALIEANPASWIRVSGGARVDIHSTFGPIVIPRAALILRPRKDGTLKIMGGRAFRAPSIYEQNYNDNDQTQAKASPLRPESVYSGEIEYSQRFLQRWVALAAVSASFLEHLINTSRDPRFSDASGVESYQNSPLPALAVGGELEVRREWRQGFMVGATYGYQYARYLDPRSDNPRLVAAPEHLASVRGVSPIVSELCSLGVRATLEAPRRIDTKTTDVTPTSVILDATLSGSVSRFGVRYTVGIYNLTGWRSELPVTETFLSRVMPQNGRTFLVDVTGTYPP